MIYELNKEKNIEKGHTTAQSYSDQKYFVHLQQLDSITETKLAPATREEHES